MVLKYMAVTAIYAAATIIYMETIVIYYRSIHYRYGYYRNKWWGPDGTTKIRTDEE